MLLNLLPSRLHQPNCRFACVALCVSVCLWDKCACVLSVRLHRQASKPFGEWRIEGFRVWQGEEEWGPASSAAATQCRMAAAWMHAQLIALIAYGAGSEKTVCICVGWVSILCGMCACAGVWMWAWVFCLCTCCGHNWILWPLIFIAAPVSCQFMTQIELCNVPQEELRHAFVRMCVYVVKEVRGGGYT